MTTQIQRAQENFGEMLMNWHNSGDGESIHPEFGQLLLFVGIYLNNFQMVETACNHYPEKTRGDRNITPWAYNLLEQLRMLQPIPNRNESPINVQDIEV
tara:strand:- start:291 stop:587 length:297 start_codon:yes stop_codon:yes gene_type:complete